MTEKLNIQELITKYAKVKKAQYIEQNIADLRTLRDKGVPFKHIADEVERVTGVKISVTYLRNKVGANKKGAGYA